MTERASPRRTSVPLVTLLVALACLALGAVIDGGYERLLLDRERASVRASAAELSRGIERGFAQRVALLAGMRAFAESHADDRARLDRDFPLFASGLLTGIEGVRALQLVQDGVIIATWPVAGNESVIGYDLKQHPDPRVPADVRRALATNQVVVTGPIGLVQGGSGLLARLATGTGSYPELVNVILDVETLLADAGLDAVRGQDRFTLRATDGTRIAGAENPLDAPVITDVTVADGDWQLLTVPEAGWGAAMARERRLLRISMFVIGALIVGIARSFSGRQGRLVRAVDERTLALREANRELAREVEERRTAEREARDRAEELRLALSAGKMGVWVWEVVTGRMIWNEGVGELYGVQHGPPASYEAFLGLLEPEERAALDRAVQATLTKGAPYRVQHRVLGADGQERWLYATAELERDETGAPVRLRGIVMDVTARTGLEQQLRQAQKMEAVGTLAGGIAHDFNNLLTAILGFARLAQESLADSTNAVDSVPRTLRQHIAHASDDLAELIRAGDRAALLTAQLLSFSRQQVVRSSVIDVNAAVAELERMLTRLLDARITLMLALHDTPVFVRADPGQLAQVVLNLVVNARDAMPDGGEITVSTHRHDAAISLPATLGVGPWIEVRVADTGVGIPADIRDRIFDPFFTTKATGKGTGLGLSTAYGIVTQADGHIVVDSVEGEGTVMRVFLPLVLAPTDLRTPARGRPSVRSGRETILVVEDEPGVRRLVSEILERAGYAVHTAANGRDAVAALAADHAEGRDSGAGERGRIALVVSDVVMPEMGGVELLHTVGQEHPGLPVLLMSGNPMSQSGAPDPSTPMITKPFSPTELLSQVRALLDDREKDAPIDAGPLQPVDSTS